MEPRKTIIAYAIKYNGDWDKIYQALHRLEVIEPEYEERVDNLKCGTLVITDINYPAHIRNIFKPPFVFFYYGDISLIYEYSKNVSIVGSRDCSDYGAEMTKQIASGLAARGFVIVSGLARGIDGIAHESAINSGGKTIGILGCGIDYCYPQENIGLYRTMKKDHLILSEFPGSVMPQPYQFPIRNRLIAGLSKTLVVTEAGYCSGSLITATLALRSNTDVMCVPHEAGKQSECNRLIMNGAYLVESAEDVIEQMPAF